MRRPYQNYRGNNKAARKVEKGESLKHRYMLEDKMSTVPVPQPILDHFLPIVETYLGELFNDDATYFPRGNESNFPYANIFSEDPANYSVSLRYKAEYTYGKILPVNSTEVTLSYSKFNQLIDLLWDPILSCGYNTVGKLVGVCRCTRLNPEVSTNVPAQLDDVFFSLKDEYLPHLYPQEIEAINDKVVQRLENISENENAAIIYLTIMVKLGVYNFLSGLYVDSSYITKISENGLDEYVNYSTGKIVRHMLYFFGLFNLETIKEITTISLVYDLLSDINASPSLPSNLAVSSKDFCLNAELVKGAEKLRLEGEKKKEERREKRRVERKKEKILFEYKKLGLDKSENNVDENVEEDGDTDNE